MQVTQGNFCHKFIEESRFDGWFTPSLTGESLSYLD